MNNTLMITVCADGDAFDDNQGGHYEMARLIRKIADEIEAGWVQGRVVDANGNSCGEYSW